MKKSFHSDLRCLLFLCLTMLIACTPNKERTNISTALSYMEVLCDSLEKNQKWMGSITIIQQNEILYSRQIGYAYMDSSIAPNQSFKIDEHTKFRIASVTKTFTAVMIFQLMEEGKLGLQTKLHQFFPEIQHSNNITIEDLLSHSSGIHDYINDTQLAPEIDDIYTKDMIINKIVESGSDFKPGTQHSYSNPNYQLLGFIIEILTGKSYEEELESRITKPLDLIHTFYGSKINSENNEAKSFFFHHGSWLMEKETDMSIPRAAGGIVSTSKELAIFIDKLFDKELITAKSLIEMCKTFNNKFGKGVIVSSLPDNTLMFWHEGRIDNFYAMYAYLQDKDISISITTNAYIVQPDLPIEAFIAKLYNIANKIPTFDKVELSTEEIEKLIGSYVNSKENLSLKILFENGVFKAELSGNKRHALKILNEKTLVLDIHNASLNFRELKKGKFQEVFIEQNQPMLFKRVNN